MNATPPILVTENNAAQIKRRTAIAVVRAVQELAPQVDQLRLLVQEVTDVTDTYGTLTDEDLAELGISAATVNGLLTFANKVIEFVDAGTASRKPYRSHINAVRRVGVY